MVVVHIDDVAEARHPIWMSRGERWNDCFECFLWRSLSDFPWTWAEYAEGFVAPEEKYGNSGGATGAVMTSVDDDAEVDAVSKKDA